jgi:predicted dehydrogenase
MIKAAVIGTGGIARAHIEAYKTFPSRCKITRMVDIAPGKAAEAAAKAGLDAAGSERFEDAVNDPEVDLVDICTPPFEHAKITCAALNAGKHVIVEKPMAASLEECDAMLEAAKRSGRVFSPVAQNRFRASVARLKKMLESGAAGRVCHAQADSFWWRDKSYYDIWWRGTWEKENGGCTLNHAVHHIDMLIWMLGMPEGVTALLRNAAHDNSEVEDLSISALEYAESAVCSPGAAAQITASAVHHGEEQQIIFQCEKARISMPWKVYASTGRPGGSPEENRPLEEKLSRAYAAIPEPVYEGHRGQIDDVLTAIETGREPLVGGIDGRNTVELITAIYKSGSGRQAVELPLQRDDPFYTAAGILKSVPRFYKKASSRPAPAPGLQ